MTYVKFDVYCVNDVSEGCGLDRTVEFDTKIETAAVQQQMVEQVLELKKDKKLWISPNCEEAAWILLKPKRRGRQSNVSPDVVVFVHERYVNHGDTFTRIPLLVFKEFGVEVSENIVKRILKQERDTDVPGIDDLRELVDVTNTNRKHSDEDVDQWVEEFEAGKSGSEIAKERGLNSATVNARLNKRGVDRTGRERGRMKVTEEVAEEVVE